MLAFVGFVAQHAATGKVSSLRMMRCRQPCVLAVYVATIEHRFGHTLVEHCCDRAFYGITGHVLMSCNGSDAV